MDISVSHLNNRLALQLPAELPLGLVFVVGKVDNLVESSGDPTPVNHGRHRAHFDLVEANYRLRCRLTARATSDGGLHEGDTVRVGGHLMFDSHRADYFLVVRDVEAIGEPTAGEQTATMGQRRAVLASALADVRKRARAAQLAPAELPDWVQKMAPPEVQAAPETEAAGDAPVETGAPDEFPEAALSSELVRFAAGAIESEEEVELKPEIIEKLAPAAMPPLPPRLTSLADRVEAETATATHGEVEPPAPGDYTPRRQQHETDWLVILLIFSFLVLTVAVVVASILLLIR